jgi:hypothetical protein
MRKSQMVGAALVAVFAFCALTASSASAQSCLPLPLPLGLYSIFNPSNNIDACEGEVTVKGDYELIEVFLLATWLVNGAEVTTELTVESTGELLLEDDKAPLVGKAAVLCSVIIDGWVGPNSLGFESEILTLAGLAVGTLTSGTRLACTSQTGCEATPAPLVNALNLGWETEVALAEGATSTTIARLRLPHAGGGNPGWEVECNVLGVKVVDECTGPEFVSGSALEGASLLEAIAGGATCTQGGANSGLIEGHDTVGLTGGGELAPSSEGFEA